MPLENLVDRKKRNFDSVYPGEDWLDESEPNTWFHVTAFDPATGIIFGYRYIYDGSDAFTKVRPMLHGEATISDLEHFRMWCIK